MRFGKLKDDLELYKKLCSKINIKEFSPSNGEYFTFEELFLRTRYSTEKELSESAFSFYLGIEEDEWNPSKELCSLLVVMKYEYNKVWNPIEENWEEN